MSPIKAWTTGPKTGQENPIAICDRKSISIPEARKRIKAFAQLAAKPRKIKGFLPILSDKMPEGRVIITDTKEPEAAKSPIVEFEALKDSSAYIENSTPPIFIPRV
jgi:hypothetical protein